MFYGPNIQWEYIFLSLHKEIQKAVKLEKCNEFFKKVTTYFSWMRITGKLHFSNFGNWISFSFQINVALTGDLYGSSFTLYPVTLFEFPAQDSSLPDKYLFNYLFLMCVPLLEYKLMRRDTLSCVVYRRQSIFIKWMNKTNKIYLNLTKFISIKMCFAMPSKMVPWYHVCTWICSEADSPDVQWECSFRISTHSFFFIMATASLHALSSVRKSECISSANYQLLYYANKYNLAILDSHLLFMMKC